MRRSGDEKLRIKTESASADSGLSYGEAGAKRKDDASAEFPTISERPISRTVE
jgi:hypothetical protein